MSAKHKLIIERLLGIQNLANNGIHQALIDLETPEDKEHQNRVFNRMIELIKLDLSTVENLVDTIKREF